MSDFISLTCPSCGSKLQITKDIEQFLCVSCRNEYIVKRNRGIVSLAPVVDGLKDVKVGVDKTASELAIKRLQKEIAALENELSDVKVLDAEGIKEGFSMLLFGILMAAFFIWITDDKDIYINICIGIGVLIAIGGLVVVLQGTSDATQGKINAISSKLRQKRKELLRHQNIVSEI